MSMALSKQKTLSRYVEVEVWKHRELADLQPVMKGIESACRGISTLVRRAQCDEIAGLHGSSGDTNVQGEVQKVRSGSVIGRSVDRVPGSACCSRLPCNVLPPPINKFPNHQKPPR
jgi:hypothetical protein